MLRKDLARVAKHVASNFHEPWARERGCQVVKQFVAERTDTGCQSVALEDAVLKLIEAVGEVPADVCTPVAGALLHAARGLEKLIDREQHLVRGRRGDPVAPALPPYWMRD